VSTTVALVVKLVAKPETQEELAEFLTGALELANAEAGTPVWFALRTDATTFWIVDAFPGDAERQQHLGGPIAAALMEHADRLLASPPEINVADVLAAKVS
jgi:quinol monooxygenase YgiN